MSEQKTNYMAQLDAWIDANIVEPTSNPQLDWDVAVKQVKNAVRAKVLESYHNGQAAGPNKSRSFQAR